MPFVPLLPLRAVTTCDEATDGYRQNSLGRAADIPDVRECAQVRWPHFLSRRPVSTCSTTHGGVTRGL